MSPSEKPEQQDSKRLDWLERQAKGNVFEWVRYYDFAHLVGSNPNVRGAHSNIREAIDAAMGTLPQAQPVSRSEEKLEEIAREAAEEIERKLSDGIADSYSGNSENFDERMQTWEIIILSALRKVSGIKEAGDATTR